MKKVNIFIVFLISFLYMEIICKLLLHINLFNLSFINMILFLIPLCLLLSVLTNLTKNSKINKIIFFSILGVISIWFSAQYVMKGYFDFYISLSAFKLADQIGDFAGKGVIETLRRLPGIISLFIPFILCIIFNKKINFHKAKWQKSVALVALSLVSYGVYILGLNINKNQPNSPYILNYQVNDVALNVEYLGVLNAFKLDITRLIFGFNEKITFNNTLNGDNNSDKDDEPIVYEYNNLDIDFDTLIQKETNSNLKQLHEYFKNDPGTLKNEYTGLFKGKNLILFMAESFNEIAVDEKRTPTLYKLVNSGFVFNNFYSPTIYSTIGGEFQELSGLVAADLTTLSTFRSGKNYFPQGIATKFKELKYDTFAYHNNYSTFQDRNKYLSSLGFDYFKACGTGLEKLIDCSTSAWPRSDVDMINTTVDEYINKDKFMVFYATNSGHSSYDGFNSNKMAKKHREEYEALGFNYSSRISTYLAAQMDLDQALESLIKKLDESGKLEDTVIALVGDHYPYDLNIDEINEAAKYEKDVVVEVNHSNFILWNSEMDKVEVNKVGSQIDVMPTIYNAFGINYDSRLFIGKDILSTEGGLAIFNGRSWVTDKGTYFANTGKFVPKEGAVIEDGYVKSINEIVKNKVAMSKSIIANNYYNKVLS